MDRYELKGELRRRGWTCEQLAEKLNMRPGLLAKKLCGASPISEQLSAHIKLLFRVQDCTRPSGEEATLEYRTVLLAKEAANMCPGLYYPRTEEELRVIEETVARAQMATLYYLAKVAKECGFLPEKARQALGLTEPL